MSSDQLRTAVQAAGPVSTAQAVALLLEAGETALQQLDPAALIYVALASTLRRDENGIDPVLVSAALEATERLPGTVPGVARDLHQAGPAALPGALAREVTLALHQGYDLHVQAGRDLASLDDDGPRAA